MYLQTINHLSIHIVDDINYEVDVVLDVENYLLNMILLLATD